jgi:hypothetical protein
MISTNIPQSLDDFASTPNSAGWLLWQRRPELAEAREAGVDVLAFAASRMWTTASTTARVVGRSKTRCAPPGTIKRLLGQRAGVAAGKDMQAALTRTGCIL